jgi:hypothetical protein
MFLGCWCWAYLYKVFTLGLGDEGLQLGCGKGVNKTRLGYDEQQYLGAGQDRKLVGLEVRVSEECGAGVFLMRHGSGASACQV